MIINSKHVVSGGGGNKVTGTWIPVNNTRTFDHSFFSREQYAAVIYPVGDYAAVFGEDTSTQRYTVAVAGLKKPQITLTSPIGQTVNFPAAAHNNAVRYRGSDGKWEYDIGASASFYDERIVAPNFQLFKAGVTYQYELWE